jgi:hypothetical protein
MGLWLMSLATQLCGGPNVVDFIPGIDKGAINVAGDASRPQVIKRQSSVRIGRSNFSLRHVIFLSS